MRPKKSLGQNFLTSESVVNKIVETANLKHEDVVLEVGPGKGILTQTLLRSVGKVIAVEKDSELISFLQEKFKKEIKNEKLILMHGDILTFDFKNLRKRSGLEEDKEGENAAFLSSDRKRQDLDEKFYYKIVANIPYYITGEFLRKVLSSDTQPSQMVILLQKEVVERIARSKKESILSISVKAYGEPKYIQTVKAGNFNPAPKVDSAILAINNISKFFFSKVGPCLVCRETEKRFFEVVKNGFAHKRKLLISNLRVFADREKLEKIFDKLKINKKARAEDLSVLEWREIVQSL